MTRSATMFASPLHDAYGRAITDLRLSVTERCNFRCVYCRTGETPSDGFRELSIGEYGRILELFVGLGVTKVRFTGGEPLLRAGLLDLIRFAAQLPTGTERPAGTESAAGTEGPAGTEGAAGTGRGLDLALTTNGSLLASMARDLKAAGLSRVTVSLDAVEPEAFARIARVPAAGFERIRDGIRAAQDAGLGPVKINCVLLRGFNDDQIEAFADFAREEDLIVRFIEFMPLEEPGAHAGGWTRDMVVPMSELLERLGRVGTLVELAPHHASETARRFGFADGRGEIGIIAPVSNPFCGQCSRVRVTADGKIRTCLFSQKEHDLVGRIRSGETTAELEAWIRSVVDQKEARHHIGEAGFLKPSRSMVQIGG